MEDGKKRLQQQIERQERIQEMGLNLVWCGHCGAYQLQPTTVDEYQCHECGIVADVCDFPDVFHEGMTYYPLRREEKIV